MYKRVELPIKVLKNSIAINHRYAYYKEYLIDLNTNKKEKISDEPIKIMPKGKLMYIELDNVFTQNKGTYIWERKESDLILRVKDKILEVYNIEKRTSRKLTYLYGEEFFPLNDSKVIVYEKESVKIIDINTRKSKRIGRFVYPFFNNTLLTIRTHRNAIEDPKSQNILFTQIDIDTLKDVNRVRINMVNTLEQNNWFIRNDNNSFFFIAEVDKEEETSNRMLLIGKNRVIEDAEIPGQPFLYIPDRLLIWDTQTQIYDLHKKRVIKEVELKGSRYCYIPLRFTSGGYHTPLGFNTGGYYSGFVVENGEDTRFIEHQSFSDIAFNTPRERLELKCTIYIFLDAHITRVISDMIFRCLDNL